ncbi:MAG: beta-lactamase [Gemmatimonadetes bacterium]|nr:beta-lactamase [Gemmatimonadota bacterium]
MRLRRACPALVLCVVAAAPLHAQDAAALERRVDSLFARYQKGVQPGLALAVIRDNRVVFRKSYGYASLEHGIPITTSSVFDAASVSKQFTGLAVSMLIDQGRINLTDDVRKYIPEMYAFGPPITIEHLLHHTSGLRDWPGMLQLAGWNDGDVIAFNHILRFAYNQRTLNFVPGAEHTYSNTNYNLLAEVVARVSGKSFRAFTDENIFRPLGMANTHFRTRLGDVIPNRAYSYSQERDSSFNLVANGLLAQGSSSLFTTVDDLAKWVVNFGTYSVGGRSAVERTLQPGRLNDGSPVKYGFGVLVDTWRGVPMITHNGSWAGYTSFTVYFPTLRGGVVILSNAGINSDAAGIGLSEIFFAKDLVPAAPPAKAAAAAGEAVGAAPLDSYVGVYRLGPAWYVNVRRDGDILRVRASGEDEFPMTMRSSREFWVEDYGASMTFEPGGLVYRGKKAPRVDLVGERPLRIADYVGDYENSELSVTYQVSVRDTSLVLRNFKRGSFPMVRAFGDEFRAGGSMAVAFERDATGKVIGFAVDMGERNRNVRFVRPRE